MMGKDIVSTVGRRCAVAVAGSSNCQWVSNMYQTYGLHVVKITSGVV